MPKPSHRDKILEEGLKVVHANGYANASVRDIVRAAGVPQGSFTNHFGSKEAFGLEVIDLYFAGSLALFQRTLRNDELPPLQRLRKYIDEGKNGLAKDSMRTGCLYGNFAAEASEHSEQIRLRLLEIFGEVQQSISYCLRCRREGGRVAAQPRLRRGGRLHRVVASRRQSDGQGRTPARCRSSASRRSCSARS